MYKLALLLVISVAYVQGNVPEPANRFLAATRTSTVVVLSTTTIPTTVKRTCWTTAAASVPACRRRRGIEEQPEISGLDVSLDELIKPSQVLPVVPTAAAFTLDESKAEAAQAVTDLESSSEVEISGLDSCLGRSALGITLYYTTSTTIVLTSFSTATSGSTSYSIAGCIPSVISNDKC